jgi:hypothetical protein
VGLPDDVIIAGDLTVNGTTTTINSTTLTVDDKNIELGSVDSPTDATADGGGITLKGATDKTILWTNSTDSWDFNQNVKVTGTLDATSDFAIATDKFTVAASSGNTVVAGTLGVTGITTLAALLNADGGIAVDTDKFTVADATGNTDIAGTLGVTGITTLAALLNADGGIAVDTDKFTVADATGITVIAGLLNANGGIAVDTDKFTVADATGITVIAGLLNANGGIAVDTDKFTVADGTGITVIAGLLNANGGIAVDTDKFTVADGTGNTLVAGTLDATGDFKVNTNKFTVTASSGVTTVAGLLNANGGIAVDTDKFTVANTTGNTVIDGTLTVNGLPTTTTEDTALFINTSNEVETRDLGSMAFAATTDYDKYVKWVASDAEGTPGTSNVTSHNASGSFVFEGTGSINTAVTTDKLTISADTMGSGNSYAAGFAPVGHGTHADQFLRKDGTWVVPENDNTNTLTTFSVRDDDNDDLTIGHDKFLKFTAATGTAGTDLSGAGTTGNPFVMAITLPNDNDNTNQLTTFSVRDDDNDDKTIDQSKFLKFTAATGTAGTDISGTGTTGDPFVMAITLPNDNTNQLTTFSVRDDDGDDKIIAQDKFLKFTAATGVAGTNLTGDGTTGSPWVMAITLPNDNDNTWVANSSSDAGYVASGAGQDSQVWKTDENGVPAWRPDATGGGGGSLTTKGDLEVYTTSQTRLAVSSTDGYVLTADSGEASGLKWAAGGSGSGHDIVDESGAALTTRAKLTFKGELVAATDTDATDDSTDVTIDAKTLWLYAA